MARALLVDDTFPVSETELALTIEADPDTVYVLRPLTVDVVRAITQKHTAVVVNPQTRQPEHVVNQPAVNDGLLDHAIEDWRGVMNGDEPAPCDLAHKKLLPVDVQRAITERAQIGRVTPKAKAASFHQPA